MPTVSEMLPYVERDFVIACVIICLPVRLTLCEKEGHVCVVHRLNPSTLRGAPGGAQDGAVELANGLVNDYRIPGNIHSTNIITFNLAYFFSFHSFFSFSSHFGHTATRKEKRKKVAHTTFPSAGVVLGIPALALEAEDKASTRSPRSG